MKELNFEQMDSLNGGTFLSDFTCGIGGGVDGAIIGGVIGGPVGFVTGLVLGTLIGMGCSAGYNQSHP
jgi:hypothetical protein